MRTLAFQLFMAVLVSISLYGTVHFLRTDEIVPSVLWSVTLLMTLGWLIQMWKSQ